MRTTRLPIACVSVAAARCQYQWGLGAPGSMGGMYPTMWHFTWFMWCYLTPSPMTEWRTDACERITFPSLLLRAVIMIMLQFSWNAEQLRTRNSWVANSHSATATAVEESVQWDAINNEIISEWDTMWVFNFVAVDVALCKCTLIVWLSISPIKYQLFVIHPHF